MLVRSEGWGFGLSLAFSSDFAQSSSSDVGVTATYIRMCKTLTTKLDPINLAVVVAKEADMALPPNGLAYGMGFLRLFNLGTAQKEPSESFFLRPKTHEVYLSLSLSLRHTDLFMVHFMPPVECIAPTPQPEGTML